VFNGFKKNVIIRLPDSIEVVKGYETWFYMSFEADKPLKFSVNPVASLMEKMD
jgi:hypothetical protein